MKLNLKPITYSSIKKNVDVNLHKSISVKARPVSEVLSILLHESPIIYKIEGNHIILTKKEITQTPTIKKNHRSGNR